VCVEMVDEMRRMMTDMEPEPSHLRSSIGQLILIDRGSGCAKSRRNNSYFA